MANNPNQFGDKQQQGQGGQQNPGHPGQGQNPSQQPGQGKGNPQGDRDRTMGREDKQGGQTGQNQGNQGGKQQDETE